ncbi:MAG: BON domain-containing protein [Limisphaerales bacterium]
MMKTTIILIAASLTLVGCAKKDETIKEQAKTEKDQIEQSKDAQKDTLKQQQEQIDKSRDASKDQIEAQAKAQKEKVEAEAKSAEAQIKAEKKQAEAQADAAKANVEAEKKAAEAQAAAARANAEAEAKRQKETADAAAKVPTVVPAPDAAVAPADRTLTEQVQKTLTADAAAGSQNVKITVAGGEVTLRGTVKTDAEKTDLETRAKAIAGVTKVNNEIQVKAE